MFSLILGGGSARGFAHIGVIRRLEELDKPPSLIVGTSIGAIIGAMYAAGYTSQEIGKFAKEANIFWLLDPSFTKGGIKGIKIMNTLKKYLGDKTFGDVKIPIKIIATNFTTGEKIVFQNGKLINAIRASISIPGIFLPFEYKNKLCIDGGIVANLAVEEAIPNKKVVAVSVQIPIKLLHKTNNTHFLKQNPLYNTYSIIGKTINIMMLQNEENSLRSRKNVHLIRIGLPEIWYDDFAQIDTLIQEGYAQSKKIGKYLA